MEATESPTEAVSLDGLPSLPLLYILRSLQNDLLLVHLRTISRRLRDLVDLELQRSFVERWRLAGVAVPPASATAYASPRLPQRFALCHELAPRDSLAGLAVRYRSDVVALRRFNSLLSDHSLSSRTHLFVPLPVPDAAASAPEAPATAGRRAAFVRDPHTQRRFVLLLGEGKQLPSHLCGGGGGSGNCSSSKGVISPGDATSTSAPSTSQPDSSLQPQPQPACVVDKLAAAMQRALRIDAPTAAFYVSSAGCNLRAAMDKYEEDRRWERAMRHRRGALLRALR